MTGKIFVAASIFDAAVDDAGCYILTVQPTLVCVPVGSSQIVSSWNFRTRNRSEACMWDLVLLEILFH